MNDINNTINVAKEALQLEGNAILNLCNNLDDNFVQIVDEIIACSGKVIISGMGKSGIIGKKVAATLASTGTPSFFMHPGEAYHGDLGMIESKDVVICISNSGETDEILKLIPYLRDNGNITVSMTGNTCSTLAKNTTYHINTGVEKEACPLELAPTTSTTAQLAMGDALAVTIMRLRDFQPGDYARFHPGGSLGRKLLTKAKDLMKSENLPIVASNSNIVDVIHSMTEGRLGLTVVIENCIILGIITDGDIRRTMERYKDVFFTLVASDIMTKKPKTIEENIGILEVQKRMNEWKINSLLVTKNGDLKGVVQIYDI